MKEIITLYNQIPSSNYTKLQEYDYPEYNGKKYQAAKATFKSQKFEFLRFKSGRYENCIFNDCIFNSVGLSGTHFLSCELNNFEISDSNMQFCDFSQKRLVIFQTNLSHNSWLIYINIFT